MRTFRLATLALTFLCAHPLVEGAPALERCTGNHGNVLMCGQDYVYGLTVSPSGDGSSYSSLSWREYQEGDTRKWRNIDLDANGKVYFIIDQGQGDARTWLSLTQWIFSRTQRITIARVPGQLRFEVTDPTGMVWVLVGTQVHATATGFVVESIGGKTQRMKPVAPNEGGVMGIDLVSPRGFYLEHRVGGYGPPSGDQTAAARMMKQKSIFHDRRGRTCSVPNSAIFDERAGFPLETDATLAKFLARRCPKLDLRPLRNATPPPPIDRDRHTKCLPGTARIGTPAGERRVDTLRAGDVVWTLGTAGARVAAPIVRVASVDAGTGHELVRLVLADGRTVAASALHPTASGVPFGELGPGRILDGSVVLDVERVPLGGSRTYDILPAGPSGTYFADGVLLGSTLR